jgi:hypothetical protein
MAGVLSTGGGRVDLERAAGVAATFSPASLSFGINKLKKKDVTLNLELKVRNVTGDSASFSIVVDQLDPGEGVTVAPSTDSLAISAGETASVTLTITALRLVAKRRDYTGFIRVTSGGQTQNVPYWVRFVKKKK